MFICISGDRDGVGEADGICLPGIASIGCGAGVDAGVGDADGVGDGIGICIFV
ncbi:MAG TPA: hypothetical protein VGJ69_10370 [Pyrinomonadaceae bacterium]|jgi:hypothetical protein